jgi:hypothetical protein
MSSYVRDFSTSAGFSTSMKTFMERLATVGKRQEDGYATFHIFRNAM